MRPLRFELTDLCEKFHLVNVLDALVLACEEKLRLSRDIPEVDSALNDVIADLEILRNKASEIPWQ